MAQPPIEPNDEPGLAEARRLRMKRRLPWAVGAVAVVVVLGVVGAVVGGGGGGGKQNAASSGGSHASGATGGAGVVTTGAVPEHVDGGTGASGEPATTRPPCTLASGREVLVRYVAPGMPAQAQELGGVDLATCTTTLASVLASSAKGAGYCTTVAWADQNPGYDVNAAPAAALKHVIGQVGGGC